MNIAYFTNVLGAKSETFVSELIFGLKKKNNVAVYCNKNISIDIIPDYVNENNILYLLVKAAQSFISKAFNLFLVDLTSIYLNNLYLKLLKKSNVMVGYVDFGLNAVNYYKAMCKLGIPFYVHFHGLDITLSLNSKKYKNELDNIFKLSKGIIVASHHIKRLLILEGCDPKKIHIVRYGISVSGFQPVKWDDKLNDGHFHLCFLGRMTKKKNPKALILMLNKVERVIPNIKLHLIGDGPEIDEVITLISNYNLKEKVCIYGELCKSEAMKILRNCHIYVQHSVTPYTGDQEGWAISLSEASLLGLPVVSTLHNGIPENIEHGLNGLLCKEYDYEGMADHVIYLLQNKSKALELGNNGIRKFSEDEYSHTYRAERISKILKSHD